MDVKKVRHIIVVTALLLSGFLGAQNQTLEENLKKAKWYYSKSDLDNAQTFFVKAHRIDTNNIEALTYLFYITEYKKNWSWMSYISRRLKTLDSKKTNFYALMELSLYLKMQKYEKAEACLRSIKASNYKFDDKENNKLKHLEQSLVFAKQAVANPVPFDPINMGENINTEYAEYLPCLTQDGNEIIYTRHLPISHPFSSLHEDFFISKKKEGAWKKSVSLSRNINTTKNEGAPSIYEAGNILYFSSCNKADSKGLCDLYYTVSKGNYWTRPKNIHELNTEDWESQPSISFDGKTIYFVSNRPGGYGGKDIWAADKISEHKFGEPYNLGPSINTVFDEISPFIHADDNTLYFSSNGWPSIGSKDIFVSFRQADNAWSEPVNMGYPINSVNNDNSLFVDPGNKYAYFSSNRKGGYGKEDIYFFELTEQNRPKSTGWYSAVVVDKATKDLLDIEYSVWSEKTKRYTTEKSAKGQISKSIMPGVKYMLSVQAKGYMYYSSNIDSNTTSELKRVNDTIRLSPVDVQSTFTLKNIEFDFDSSVLKALSLRELDLFAAYLQKMPYVRIRIEGHTDLKGEAVYNQKLSEERAQSVKTYLLKQGIAEDRILTIGFGASKPLSSKEENQGRNRRVVIRFI